MFPGLAKTTLGQFSTGILSPYYQMGEGFMNSIPLGRLGKPSDVGAAYAFLASDRAGFATGANIVLDGGFTLRPLTLVSRSEIENINL